ncbi:MAG TPA: hypothetical protein VIV55_03110 [Flavobacterium sp.]
METKSKYNQEKVNSVGLQEKELIHTYDENIGNKCFYKEGILLETINDRITLEGKTPLVGQFKKEIPFEGFFVSTNEFEIPLIDYYESGIFVAQYTCTLLDLIKCDDQWGAINWSKTIYENNKPFDGLLHREEFNLGETHLLASEYYKNGLITNVDLWLMAVHYAELIKIKFEPNGYIIYKEKLPRGGDPEIDRRPRSVSIHFKDPKNGSVIFKVVNKIISKYKFSLADVSQQIKKTAGSVSYVFNDNTLSYVQRYDFETNEELYKEDYSYNQNIISQVYMGMNSKSIPCFTADGENDYSLILKWEDRFNCDTVLYLGENGNPFRGYLIEKEEQSDKYKYAQYLDSKVIAKADMLSIKDIEKLITGKG